MRKVPGPPVARPSPAVVAKGQSAAESSTSNAQVLEEVVSTIDSGKFALPLLPEIAMTLSRVASRPNVPMREVEAAVSRDPAVAGRVLSVANSAAYNRGTPVSSLGTAIVRLGLGRVRDLAYQVVAQNRIFHVPEYATRTRELFEAAQAGGLVAREICRILRMPGDLAYLCGLFRDLGESVILGLTSEMKRPRGTPIPSIAELSPIIDSYHAPLGAKVAGVWKLPEAIGDAILYHHHPEQSHDPSRMALVTRVADLALAHVGLGVPQQPIAPNEHPAFSLLGLGPDQGQAVLEYTELLVEDPAAWAMPSV